MRRVLVFVALAISSNYNFALPPSTDGSLEKLQVTEYEHKQCYQEMSAGGIDPGVFGVDVLRGIDGVFPGTPRSNTHEFPWVHTAGHPGKRKHYVSIPGEITFSDVRGRWPEHGDVERVVKWTYPSGTLFVEELYVGDAVFEIRTKRKLADGRWASIRYNPWESAEELVTRLVRSDNPDARRYATLLQTPKLSPYTLRVEHNRAPAFKPIKGERDDLPPMPASVRDLILSWKFVPHAEWRAGIATPSTTFEGSIVPKDYGGYAFPGGSKSCMTCHEQAGMHAFAIQDRDWYGRVRGSDGIFSFHIFDEETISSDRARGKPIKYNPNLKLKRIEQ